MIQSTSINSTPIKPHHSQSFGRNDVMTATAEWLEEVQDGNLTETNFKNLDNVAEKMHDGPFKTFVKILSIGGGAFAAAKIGSTKIINNLSKNPTVSKTVVEPLTKAVHGAIEVATEKLQTSKYFGEANKGFKPFVVNNLAKGLDLVKTYGQRGVENVQEVLSAQIKDLRAKAKGLSNVDKVKYTQEIKNLKERMKYAPAENLVKKVTSTTAGAGAGTIAVVEANKDANGNGIADIAEHN